MTPQKAIEILERLQEPEPWESQITSETWEALQMGIDAVEKQKAKKAEMYNIYWRCPSCGSNLQGHPTFCGDCGQKVRYWK